MAADLGVGEAALLDAFGGKRQSMAIRHYPPCRQPDKVMGNTQHTDGLGLTVLLHVDDTPGLQMLRDGRWFWFPVRPLPSALVVNDGDILHILTNGAYKSIEHRVVVNAERGRTTAVIFQDASVDGLVTPLPELLLKGGEAPRYKSIPRFEYLKVRFSALAKKEGFIESLKL
jgi:isopenicillin N synthase-like dioxygenase